MVTMMSTKMTKGGQTTVPKEIRRSLGIADDARVYWTFDGSRAWVSAAPAMPLEVAGVGDFRDRLGDLRRAAEMTPRATVPWGRSRRSMTCSPHSTRTSRCSSSNSRPYSPPILGLDRPPR